jgi:hypothetical protein
MNKSNMALKELFDDFDKTNEPFWSFQQICNNRYSHKEIVEYIRENKKYDIVNDVLEDFVDKSNRLRIFYTHEYFNVFMVLCKIDLSKMAYYYNSYRNTKLYDEYRTIFDSFKLAIDINSRERKMMERIESMEMRNEILEREIRKLEIQIRYQPGGEGYLEAKEEFDSLKN